MNALYLQLFPEPVLIDPLGYGEDDARKNVIRLACPKEFRSDLGGQFRYWKTFQTNSQEKGRYALIKRGLSLEQAIVHGLEYDLEYIEEENVGDYNCVYTLEELVDHLISGHAKRLFGKQQWKQMDELEAELDFYFGKLQGKLFKKQHEMPAKVTAMHEKMNGKKWWNETIKLARCPAAQKLFGPLRPHKGSKVRPSQETIILVQFIAQLGGSVTSFPESPVDLRFPPTYASGDDFRLERIPAIFYSAEARGVLLSTREEMEEKEKKRKTSRGEKAGDL